MAQEVGATILQAAQQINQQIATQNQMALQQSRFAQQVQAAEESVRLREQNLELSKKKNELDADIAQKTLDLKTEAGKRTAKSVQIQREQLDLKLKLMDDDFIAAKKDLAKLAVNLTQSEIDLNNARAAGVGQGVVRGKQTQSQRIKTMQEVANSVVYNSPEFQQAAGATKEELAEFGAFGEPQISSMVKRLEGEVGAMRTRGATIDPTNPTQTGATFLAGLAEKEKQLKAIQTYQSKLKGVATEAVFQSNSAEPTAIRKEVESRMAQLTASTPQQLRDASKAFLDGELPGPEEAYKQVIPAISRDAGTFEAFKNAFVGDFADPGQLELSAVNILKQLPPIKTARQFNLIGPQLFTFNNSLDAPLSDAEMVKLVTQIGIQAGVITPGPAR